MSVQARNTGLLTLEVIQGKHVSSQESKIVQVGLLKLPFLLVSSKSHLPLSLSS